MMRDRSTARHSDICVNVVSMIAVLDRRPLREIKFRELGPD